MLARRLAAFTALALALTSLAAPAAVALDCHDRVVVVQVAGSGNGLGPAILFTRLLADGIAPVVPAGDVDVIQLGAEGHTLGYPAIGFPYSDRWFGLWGTPGQRIDNYLASVDQGVAALEHVVAGRYLTSVAGCRPAFVLVGYSQGAQVVRGALAELGDFRDAIAAVVLIADPTFDPADGSAKFGGSLGPPSPSRVGFMTVLGEDALGLPEWAADRATSICVRTDPVCQQVDNALLAPITALKFVLSPFHIWGYTSGVLAPAAGLVGHEVVVAIGA
jgi:hypothetical protein